MTVTRSAIVVITVIGAAASVRGMQQAPAVPAAPDAAQILVNRLDLERYKATIKGLTQFGDRREGTQRNRDAVAWIEAQLKSYGCATERLDRAKVSIGNVARGGHWERGARLDLSRCRQRASHARRFVGSASVRNC